MASCMQKAHWRMPITTLKEQASRSIWGEIVTQDHSYWIAAPQNDASCMKPVLKLNGLIEPSTARYVENGKQLSR